VPRDLSKIPLYVWGRHELEAEVISLRKKVEELEACLSRQRESLVAKFESSSGRKKE